MRTVAFIFARGGSKGLLRKNVRTVSGVPLVVWAIRAAQACPEVDTVAVSTDDSEIAELSVEAGAEVPELRPPELATDDAPELSAWVHAVSWFSDQDGNPEFEEFVSVPATSPLRKPSDITRCIEAYRGGDCDIVITGSPSTHHPSFNMVQVGDDGLARLVDEFESPITRRQETQGMFDVSCVAYVTSPKYVLETPSVMAGRLRLVHIPRDRALDIDDSFDLRIAEFLSSSRDDIEWL